jgi:hypothetical protein
VNELEQQLIDLGLALEFPETPDLMAGVRDRLTARPVRRSARPRLRLRRRSVALGLVLAGLLAGTAVAIPPVRHAIERVFGLNGATVERVPRLPALPTTAGHKLQLGRAISVSDARHAASFRALLPPRGADAAYVSNDIAGGRITLAVGRSLVMEFRGQSEPFIRKLIGVGTRARGVRVGGDPGLYLEGAPHEVFFADARGNGQTDTVRLAGNVLLWQHGSLILRIEGVTSLSKALVLAQSLK